MPDDPRSGDASSVRPVMPSPRVARPPVGFFEAQRRHRRRTAVLIVVELVLVWTIGNVLVFPAHLREVCSRVPSADGSTSVRTCATEWHADPGTMLAVAVFVVLFLAVAVLVARARALSGDDVREADGPESAMLREIVTQMAIASGSPTPALLLVDDPALNAYAVAGRDGGTIVCTTGLLAALDRRELTGVVAHEMAHLRNRDSTVVWVATFAVGLVVVLAGLAILFAERGAHRRAPVDPDTGAPTRATTLGQLDQEARDRSGWRLLATAFAMLMWLLARPAALLVRAAISRRREQLADASAVQFTRDPTGLRSALEKVAASPTPVRDVSVLTASLWIDAPSGPGATWYTRLLDSHPPIEQRIAWLRSLERSGDLWTELVTA